MIFNPDRKTGKGKLKNDRWPCSSPVDTRKQSETPITSRSLRMPAARQRLEENDRQGSGLSGSPMSQVPYLTRNPDIKLNTRV
jgi:hypothetical protein